MKRLNLSDVEAVDPGERERLQAGGYIVRFEDYEDLEDKSLVNLIFDVNEGPHAGFYSSDYYKGKPWAHRLMFSYKEKALPMTKGRLEKITECNPGFDAVAAFEAAQLDMFKGRKAGLVVGEEERIFRGDDGEWVKVTDLDWMRAKVVPLDKVRSGDYQVPKLRELSEADKAKLAGATASGASAGSAVYDDVPFE